MEKIVVIVPIYNAEKTIKKCIDSVMEQTYKNWELLLINDGSKDTTSSILNNYKDKRIHIITQKNLGVSVARNNGLNNVNGEYILFLDSDDYLDKLALETFLKYKKNNIDIFIICSFLSIDANNRVQHNIEENAFENLEFFKNSKNFKFFAGPSFKLFESSIIQENNIRFDESLSLGEDTIFVLEYLKYVNSIKIISEELFYINETPGSLSRRDRRDIFENLMEIYNKYVELLEYRNEYKFENIVLFYIRTIKICLNTANSFKWKYKEYRKLCKKIIQMEEFKKIKILKIKINKYDKVICLLLKLKCFALLKIFLKLKNFIMKKNRKVFHKIKNG